MNKAYLSGIGSYLPNRVVTNNDLSELMDTSDEWISKRTGISQRRWADEAECTSDLAYKASVAAIENSGLKKEDIDLIILGTLSPDHEFPGTGCFLQKKLDVPGIPVLDIRQQCTAFIYGLSIAQSFIESGKHKNILLVGAEVQSKLLDLSDRGRNVSVLFGDGAGAAIISRKKSETTSEVIGSVIHADGTFAKELWISAPGTGLGTKSRFGTGEVDSPDFFPYMNGKLVFTHAVRGMTSSVNQLLDKFNVKTEEIDLFVFHQANLRINESVAKNLGVSPDRFHNTIEKYGNTTAATIPIGLDDAVKNGRIEKGRLIVLSAFGAGFTWGSSLLRW